MRIGLVLGGDLFWTQIERRDNNIFEVELLVALMSECLLRFEANTSQSFE